MRWTYDIIRICAYILRKFCLNETERKRKENDSLYFFVLE